MVGGVALQAVIGYVQYFLHLPAGLVWVHVAGSVLLWILAVKLYLSTRTRLAAPEAPGSLLDLQNGASAGSSVMPGR